VLDQNALENVQNLSVAKRFLAAYWQADLAKALETCATDGIIELTRSLPILTPAPISVVLPLMFRDVYVRFKGERFETQIDNTLADDQRVLVEYTARGTLTNGCEFKCGYAVVFNFELGQIIRIRAYADTRYVAAPLIG